MMTAGRPRININGVRASGGGYALSLEAGQLRDLALGRRLDAGALGELRRKVQGPSRSFEQDARDLSRTGWGLILPASLEGKDLQARLEALSGLTRRRQVTAGNRFKIFSGRYGYRSGESKRDWLIRAGANPDGIPNPDRVPYYLLIAASPEEIPFSFQYQLDVQYFTGRVHFNSLEEYAVYAASVVKSEAPGFERPLRAALFAPANPDDSATRLSHDRLARPIYEYLSDRLGPRILRDEVERQITRKGTRYNLETRDYSEAELAQVIQKLSLPVSSADIPKWQVEAILGPQALRGNLENLLNGPQSPAFLFCASHGMVFDPGDTRQMSHQGALLCQDWSGPLFHQGDIGENLYFSSDHLSAAARLQGMIAFFFACYGAGTPQYDEFIFDQQRPLRLAGRDFVAALPQRMLAHPGGGALAVVGHVDRSWSFSFLADDNQPQTNVFEDALRKLLTGFPLGYAMDVFNRRYAELATEITDIQNKATIPGFSLDEEGLSDLWIAHNDARNYVILGDPAVRLPVSGSASQMSLKDNSMVELTSKPAAGQPNTPSRQAFGAALAGLLQSAASQTRAWSVGQDLSTFSISSASLDGETLIVEIALPDGTKMHIRLEKSAELYRLYRAMSDAE